jgi:hypothetical protein
MRKLIAQRMNNRLAAPESQPRNQPPGGGLFVCGSGAPADEFGRPSVGVTRAFALCRLIASLPWPSVMAELAPRRDGHAPQFVIGQLAPSDCVREHSVEAFAITGCDQPYNVFKNAVGAR